MVTEAGGLLLGVLLALFMGPSGGCLVLLLVFCLPFTHLCAMMGKDDKVTYSGGWRETLCPVKEGGDERTEAMSTE